MYMLLLFPLEVSLACIIVLLRFTKVLDIAFEMNWEMRQASSLSQKFKWQLWMQLWIPFDNAMKSMVFFALHRKCKKALKYNLLEHVTNFHCRIHECEKTLNRMQFSVLHNNRCRTQKMSIIIIMLTLVQKFVKSIKSKFLTFHPMCVGTL